jgi:pyruvyltransferase
MSRHPQQARIYYWTGRPNFGDQLAPHILRHMTGVDSRWEPVSKANCVVTGSVLEHIPPYWDGHIIGAGRLFEDSRLHLYTGTARIWALRGPLSARGIPGSFALGDPGLLADELVADEVEGRDYDLGVLPHWSDSKLAHRTEWFDKRWSTRVISPAAGPLEVVREIARCKKLVTSSLHGVIVADACGIPRRLEYSSTLDREGGQFKFKDYSASVGARFEVGTVVEAPRHKIEDRKSELADAFEALGRELWKS